MKTQEPSPHRSRQWLTAAAGALVVGQFAICQDVLAAGGDFSLDFTAAAPLTYNHSTGGGSYNDRTVGRADDIVESLEGGDFACGDTVTFLTQIRVNAAAVGAQNVRLRFEFTAHSTGQQGTALVDNVNGVSAAINSSVIDSGTVDDGGSTATALDESLNGTVWVKPTTFFRSVDVTDLEPAEKVVVRTDVAIVCNGQSPTGNMQARLASASVLSPAADTISVGDQTVPFKRVGDIKPCDPKTCKQP
jgi:hypothetical protein